MNAILFEYRPNQRCQSQARTRRGHRDATAAPTGPRQKHRESAPGFQALVWLWCGFGVALVWLWCGFGVALVWPCGGLGVALIWLWGGLPAQSRITNHESPPALGGSARPFDAGSWMLDLAVTTRLD